MANRSYKGSIKKPDQNTCTSAIKYKPMLVKDLYKSFETHSKSTTDKTRNIKEKASKVTAITSYENTYYYKPTNNEGSLLKCPSKSSVLGNDNKSLKSNNNNDIGECAMTVMHDNFTMTSPNLKNYSKLNCTKSSSDMQCGINKIPSNCENKIQYCNHSASIADSNSSNVLGIQNVIIQLKTFLEESIQTHEDQISKLKQILSNVNDISSAIKNDRIINSSSSTNDGSKKFEKTAEVSIPLMKVVSNDNKTPKSLKSFLRMAEATRRCDFQGRRRSLSMPSESDLDLSQGSFTMLEKELNIVHTKTSVKPRASPMNTSYSTPSFAKQWDTKTKQPLKAYMALKEKSALLVTPDINWFQSRSASSTDITDFYS